MITGDCGPSSPAPQWYRALYRPASGDARRRCGPGCAPAEPLQALASQVEALGVRTLVVPCDVGDYGGASAACARILEAFSHVDILFNNAGYGHHRRFLDWDIEDQQAMMQTNYFGSVYFTKLLLPQMVERRSGWLVFIASVAGKLGTPDESAYAASKFATVGMAEALSLEVEDDNVHVLTVCPGAINTPFFDAEALSRMPPVSKNHMADPEKLVDEIFRALRRGRHETTYPKGIRAGYIVRALAPEFMRRQMKRVTLDALKN
ncbi:MAG: SDR family NAD(P)-dependent oxidoreductase [Halioglobus sp.]